MFASSSHAGNDQDYLFLESDKNEKLAEMHRWRYVFDSEAPGKPFDPKMRSFSQKTAFT